MTERHDIWAVADALQMDLRAASAKLVELRARLASLDLPEATHVECPHCGLRCKGPRTLVDHLYVIHDGPDPGDPEWSLLVEPLARAHTPPDSKDAAA